MEFESEKWNLIDEYHCKLTIQSWIVIVGRVYINNVGMQQAWSNESRFQLYTV